MKGNDTSGKVFSVQFRVRYSETDQMGTFSSARALEWFECGRTELLRSMGMPYAELENRGVFCPVVEAHANYAGRARYDDLLSMSTSVSMVGRARVRFDVRIVQTTNDQPVVEGYTVHGFIDADGKPTRPPKWFVQAVENHKTET